MTDQSSRHDALSRAGADGAAALHLKVSGMDCASCAMTIESAVARLDGVRRAQVDFTTEVLEIEGHASRASVAELVAHLGYRVVDAASPGAAPSLTPSVTAVAGTVQRMWAQPALRRALGVSAAAASVAVVAPLAARTFGTLGFWLVPTALAAAVVIVALPIATKGWRALFYGRRMTIDLLMTIAAVGALAIGEYWEALAVIVLFTFGEALENLSAERARSSLRALLALQPDNATVLRPHTGVHDGHHWHAEVIAASAVQPEDRVLVRPGERVPVDGRIIEGESTLNESAVTGESVPVRRVSGEDVMAGTVNGDGALEIIATRMARDSTIARIAALVERAQAQRSPQERFVDRFARLYTPAVVALALLVVTVPVLGFGQPLLDSADGTHGWLYRGLALLIVACPCALVISIPVTVVSALTRLAGLGVLVKGGSPLDRLADIRVVAFDKTGTLTEGRPSVTALQGRDCRHPDEITGDCDDCTDVLALAASVELRSGHPIAHAIAQAARARGVTHRYPGAIGIRAIAGRGVVGEVAGARVAVGSDELFSEATPPTAVPDGFADTLRASHRTVMLVARDARIVGAIGVEDTVRDSSVQALRELSSMSPPVGALMLTGDNARVAAAVAEQLGAIGEVRAGLSPGAKLEAIDAARARHGPVAMVGDGINDGPALARADVGLAMGGSGSAQAMETADVVLMQDDLRRVPVALRLARMTRRVVRQNVALSLGLKLAFVALVIPGLATLWLAVVADVGATVLVTLNGMRLLRANGS